MRAIEKVKGLAEAHFVPMIRDSRDVALSLRPLWFSPGDDIEAQARNWVVKTRISWSMQFPLVPGENERIIQMCRALGATEYISGPAARVYIEEEKFAAAGIRLTYIDCSGYPEYPQLHTPFEHAVSIVNLIFNTGPYAPRYMQSFPPA